MDLHALIHLSQKWQDLGWAVQGQLDDCLEGNIEKCNPNALEILLGFLDAAWRYEVEGAEELAEEIRDYLFDEHGEKR